MMSIRSKKTEGNVHTHPKKLVRHGSQLSVLFVCLGFGASASAQMRITEWQYSGADLSSEFIEFTNVGALPINMTGWSFDDDTRIAGTVSLSAFGTVAAGESVILCEATATSFRDAWNLGPGVKIIGANSTNLGRNDEINLYDNTNALVDRLTFGDQNFPGSVRTNGQSGWPCDQALGLNDVLGWRLSQESDVQNSFVSDFFDIGNPGIYTSFTCPAAPIGACCAAGACLLLTAQECTGTGLYQGDGTGCAPNNCPAPSNANVRITEFMHDGVAGGEFIEFRNMQVTSVNMNGWSYSDESRVPGQVSLSSFGTVAAGEVVILTAIPAGDFRDDWGLGPAVKIIGGNSVNIGSADEINIYDASGALVDRLTYGHLTCSVDPDGMSAFPCSAAVGANDILEWRRAAIGDAQGSITNLVGDVGRPGFYTSVTCTTGSCCIDGSCSVTSQGDCLSAGGLYFGDGTTCMSHPCPPVNMSQVHVTEFMYQGVNGEFFELTNLGGSPVNLAGWSFADRCTPPGLFSLSGLGTIDPGESVIVTDNTPGSFNGAWGLSGVTVVSLPSSELGRNDQIRIHDANGALVDVLRYGDEDFPNSVHTQNISAWPIQSGIGEDRINHWVLSTVGDSQSSFASSGGDIGSPGQFQVVNIPAASTWGMVILAILIPTAATLVMRREAMA